MGIGSHKKSCKKKRDAAAEEDQFVTGYLARTQRGFCTLVAGVCVITVGSGSAPAPRFVAPWQRGTVATQSSADDTDSPGPDC